MFDEGSSAMELIQKNDYLWEIPRTGQMNVPGRIYSSSSMIDSVSKEEACKQVANVAELPGIVSASLAMPDIHWGYGFPIGGVAAFDWKEGIVSPGGVGYDINCGVRLATSNLHVDEVQSRLEDLADSLFHGTPSGVGSTGSIKLSKKEVKKVLGQGSQWAVLNGFGEELDIRRTEDHGCMDSADPEAVSERALERGTQQLGTLGSGNHFLELGVVEEIFDPDTAAKFGLFPGQITMMIHSGSRGLGYQICDDFLADLTRHARKSAYYLPDRQLAYAMIQSVQGQRYLSAMACAANYAWANRQIMMHRAESIIMRTLGISPNSLSMQLLYDVCHNIAKKEEHMIENRKTWLCVHRKGATRSFPPGHPSLPEEYRTTGQPILIPGDMGTASYILAGTEKAMAETFGSTCHGAGRVLSRNAAKKASRGRAIQNELAGKGIVVRWTGRSTLAEEMPEAYKDISDVVGVVQGAGISRKVAKLRPLVVVKG
jgi:tRNA-splicing ligase RtcB (3'-phosphate/5'-hydroxy nucleic acid ligase)